MIECLTMDSLKKEVQAFKDHDRQWNTVHLIEPEVEKTGKQRRLEWAGKHDNAPPKRYSLKEAVVGAEFGRLTIIDSTSFYVDGRKNFLVDCSCGTQGKQVRWESLRSGKTKSCGCMVGHNLNKHRGKTGWGSKRC